MSGEPLFVDFNDPTADPITLPELLRRANQARDEVCAKHGVRYATVKLCVCYSPSSGDDFKFYHRNGDVATTLCDDMEVYYKNTSEVKLDQVTKFYNKCRVYCDVNGTPKQQLVVVCGYSDNLLQTEFLVLDTVEKCSKWDPNNVPHGCNKFLLFRV